MMTSVARTLGLVVGALLFLSACEVDRGMAILCTTPDDEDSTCSAGCEITWVDGGEQDFPPGSSVCEDMSTVIDCDDWDVRKYNDEGVISIEFSGCDEVVAARGMHRRGFVGHDALEHANPHAIAVQAFYGPNHRGSLRPCRLSHAQFGVAGPQTQSVPSQERCARSAFPHSTSESTSSSPTPLAMAPLAVMQNLDT